MKQSWEPWWFWTAWLSWNVCIGEFFSQDGNSHSCPTFLCAVQTWQTVFYSDSSQKHHGTRFCIGFRFCPFSSIGARPKLTKRNSMDSVELWKFSTVKVSPYHLLSTVLLDPLSQNCCCSPAEWGEPRLWEHIQEEQESDFTARQKERLFWQSVVRREGVVGLTSRCRWHHRARAASSCSEYLQACRTPTKEDKIIIQ